jgi:hypothetical protein
MKIMVFLLGLLITSMKRILHKIYNVLLAMVREWMEFVLTAMVHVRLLVIFVVDMAIISVIVAHLPFVNVVRK